MEYFFTEISRIYPEIAGNQTKATNFSQVLMNVDEYLTTLSDSSKYLILKPEEILILKTFINKKIVLIILQSFNVTNDPKIKILAISTEVFSLREILLSNKHCLWRQVSWSFQ